MNNRDNQKIYFSPKAEGLLAPIQIFLEDKTVSEIVLNKPEEVFVEKAGIFSRHKILEFHESHLAKLFQLIANENAQRLTPQNPLLSGSLADGSRVQLILPPTAKHYTFAIRRKSIAARTLADYREEKFYQRVKPYGLQAPIKSQLLESEQQLIKLYQCQDWSAFIEAAIYHKKNLVISGGTSSGKTTFLNACLQIIPSHERLITLEDTREIEVPHRNQVNLLASKGEQGLAKVDMQALVQCSLRLRPDRLIVGEIRGKEILDFLGACSTGHEGSITSIHANNPRVAFMRMTQMYKQNQVPSMTDEDIRRELHEVVDVIVQLARDEKGRHVESIYYKYGELAHENIPLV